MGIFDVKYDFDKLVRVTSSGVEVSSFVQIKTAITRKMKEIYGNDIDLSDATGDGQFIMMISLLLYNGYNALYYLNQNYDPASASGKFLDILCGLSNIFRKGSTNSTAYLYVVYNGSQKDYTSVYSANDTIQQIQCVDTSGRIWTWVEGKGTEGFKTKFNKGEIKSLQFVCEDLGEIETFADETLKNKSKVTSEDLTKTNHGDIYMTIDNNTFPFGIWQAADAVVGQNEETDDSLKRRLQFEKGNAGVTVTNGLIGGLLAINGVKEAKLYSNITRTYNASAGQNRQAKDGTWIAYHDLYLCLRYVEGVSPDENTIGKTVHQKNTPGVVTTPFNSNISNDNYVYCLENKYGKFNVNIINVYNNILEYPIYWKQCKSIAPSMALRFMYNKDIFVKDKQKDNIIKALKKYTFDLTLYDNLNMPNLLAALNQADTPVNNQSTYFFIEGYVEGTYTGNKITSSSDGIKNYFENKDTYFSYNDEYSEEENGVKKGNIKFYFDWPSSENSPYVECWLYVYQMKISVQAYIYNGTYSNPANDYTWSKIFSISKYKDANNQIHITLDDIPAEYRSNTFYSDMSCSTSINFNDPISNEITIYTKNS